RQFVVDTYILVLGQTPAGFDVAYLTVQKPVQKSGEEPVVAARMEMGKIDSLGRLRFAAKRAASPHVPLEGPPTLESLALLERRANVAGGQKWEGLADGQPALTWTASGLTRYQDRPCLLLIGRAESGDWVRQEKLWLQLDGGYAIRQERAIEQRGGGFSSQV